MKFLVDAQLPPGLVRWLEAHGEEAVHVSDIGMVAASDKDIAALAERDEMILISKDEDFMMLRLPDRFAFLWLRCGNTTNRALGEWMDERWSRVCLLLKNGERVVELR